MGVRLKDKTTLKTLYKIKLAYDEADRNASEFQSYVTMQASTCDFVEKRRLFRGWYVSQSNLLGAVLASKVYFANSKELFEKVCVNANEEVIIPESLKSRFGAKDDISLARVLRIARNCSEHPEKVSDEKYLLVAELMNPDVLARNLVLIRELLRNELSILTQDEKRIMFAESNGYKSFIYTVQEEMRSVLNAVEGDDRVSTEAKELMMKFLKFVPCEANVKIDESMGEIHI